MRAARRDPGDVGLRLAADLGANGGGHRHGDGGSNRSVGAEREQRGPGSRQAAAERASVCGGAFDHRESGDERRAARLGNGVFERTGDHVEIAAVQAMDERAQVRPLANGIGERHGSCFYLPPPLETRTQQQPR